MKITKLFGTAAIAVSLLGSAALSASAQTLTGAGSTLVAPIMSNWTAAYQKKTSATINYQPIGSGGGINALINHTVDFAGSDVPMNANELGQAKGGVIHIPDIIGSVSVAYNIPGIGPGIHLTGPVVSDIYLGKITMWNDPRITELNPGVNFPNETIFVIHRSDGSGTTAIFTDYLCKVNPAWKSGPGTGKSVEWPLGLGGKGSSGVAGLLKTHKFSLGYVELAYATQNDITYCAIQNKKGKFIYPGVESDSAAADGVTIPANLQTSLTDTSNPDGYPIVGFSYLISYRNSAKAADLRSFLTFVTTEGQDESFTKPLFFSPIPASVRDRAQKLIAEIK